MIFVLCLCTNAPPGLLVPPRSHRYGVHSSGWQGPTLSFLRAFLYGLHALPARRRDAPGCLLDE